MRIVDRFVDLAERGRDRVRGGAVPAAGVGDEEEDLGRIIFRATAHP